MHFKTTLLTPVFDSLSFIPESVAFEWPQTKPGVIIYNFPGNLPDTRTDVLSLGFITPEDNVDIIRIDGKYSDDYIDLDIVSDH